MQRRYGASALLYCLGLFVEGYFHRSPQSPRCSFVIVASWSVVVLLTVTLVLAASISIDKRLTSFAAGVI